MSHASNSPAPFVPVDDDVSLAQAAPEFILILALGWVLTAVYGGVALVYGAYVAGVVDLAGGLVLWPLCLTLFRRGSPGYSNLALLLSSTVYVFVGQIFISPHDGFIFFYLPIGVSPLLLYRPSQRRSMLIGIAIVVVGWLLGELDFVQEWGKPYRPPVFPTTFAHFANFGGAFVMVISFLDVYARANRRLRREREAQAERARAELQRAFDQIALSERNLSVSFDVMVDGIMIQDAAGNIIKMNEAAYEKYGLGQRHFNVHDRTDWRAFDAEGRLLAIDELPSRVALRTGRPQIQIPLSTHLPDRGTVWVKVTSIPYRADGGDGPPTHAVTTIVDISAQRQADRLLYQIVNGTPDWIFIKDREHRYLNINEGFAKAIGRTPAEIIGLNDLELGFKEADVLGDPTRGRPGFWADDDMVFATKSLQTFANDFFHIEGRERCFHTIKTPLFRDDSEVPYALLCYARDITHLREIEDRLVQSSKMASLGQMAAGVAHEINNPLAIIQGTAQILAMDSAAGRHDAARTRESVEKIVGTTKRIAQIVRGLQAFSRNGENDPFAPVALPKVVDEAVALCRDKFRSSEVGIEVAHVSGVTVMGNAVQLSQVLINLLNNAHDAVAGGPYPWVRVDVDVEGPRASIAVSDGGPAIPDQVAAKLMQPFFTTKPAGRGTGLGLMLSQKIVDRHRGKLYLDRSAPQTRFVIELPIDGAPS